MARKTTRLGKLPPRYRFALNPLPEVRWSKCPRCEKLTFNRKFPLLILVKGYGEPMVLGKTCRYCAGCEFIICHQHELEDELVHFFLARAPEVVGNEYLVAGVMERKAWERGRTKAMSWDEAREHTADIKKYFTLSDPRRVWLPTDREKST
ncbi:MAG TPA: hypothetical protein VF625_00505 [Longimicrobium sp.]